MTPYPEIVEFCKKENPALIYVAIGCAQGSYPEEGGSAQQWPPFVAAWPGRKVVILIDPLLEQPARGLAQSQGQAAFFSLEKEFDWKADRPFIHDLCALTDSYLIVQDYSGHDIRPYYPLALFGPTLLDRVLFDVTGGDGGCFVDFSNVHIIRDTTGRFIQAPYTPLCQLLPLHPPTFKEQIRERFGILMQYAVRRYRMLQNLEEDRDWCTAEIVQHRLTPLTYAYRSTDLYTIVTEVIFDFCGTVGHYMTTAEVYELLHGPLDQIRTSMTVLRDLALDSEI